MKAKYWQVLTVFLGVLISWFVFRRYKVYYFYSVLTGSETLSFFFKPVDFNSFKEIPNNFKNGEIVTVEENATIPDGIKSKIGSGSERYKHLIIAFSASNYFKFYKELEEYFNTKKLLKFNFKFEGGYE
ncbi:MAG: hypothetical protein PF448_08765 [Bacteroidales bacterium]|jgi:hypothetical protein|nr:hypothetical protein [Bacteroidales bacterium]